jgi:hypothetical protein
LYSNGELSCKTLNENERRESGIQNHVSIRQHTSAYEESITLFPHPLLQQHLRSATCIRLSVDRAIALRRTTHRVIVKSVAHYESIYASSLHYFFSYDSPSVLKFMLTFGLFERDGTFFVLICIQVGREGLFVSVSAL